MRLSLAASLFCDGVRKGDRDSEHRDHKVLHLFRLAEEPYHKSFN